MNPITRRQLLKNSATLAGSFALPAVFATQAHALGSRADSLRDWFSSPRTSVSGTQLRNPVAVLRIYQRRGWAPLWSRDNQPTYTSDAVLRELVNAQLYGLSPSKYYSSLLQQLSVSGDAAHGLKREILQTDALYSFFDDIAHGSFRQREVNRDWKLKESNVDVAGITDLFFAGDYSFRQTITALEPDQPAYHNLLVSLHQHLDMQHNGDWPIVPSGRVLKANDEHMRVVALKERLSQSGDLPFRLNNQSIRFDQATEDALVAFQQRHGLVADGVLGPRSVNVLNISLQQRIAQIELNLDRWRWLSRGNGQSTIVVNVPGYQLDAGISGQPQMNMKVVVGKPDNRTPMFSDLLEYMVVNPSWYVPSSIARQELLPKEIKRRGYLQGSNFEAISLSGHQPVPLSRLSSKEIRPSRFLSRYRLRQKPGRSNALGKLKFMFPNQYSIYLHDTNARGLFARTARAYSHGCVRLEHPFDLAKHVLLNDGRSELEIDKLLRNPATGKIVLRKPVPVHLTYQTAWSDADGRTRFSPDIYGHDQRALRTLDKGRTLHAAAEASAFARTGLQLASAS